MDMKVLRQITDDNRWFAAFTRAMLRNYENKTAGKLIKQAAKDIFADGYEATRNYWAKFMDFYYPPSPPEEKEMRAIYHTRYQLQNGDTIPAVTTVLGILDKGEAFQDWLWDCGRQGVDYREVRDAAGRVGTITHRFIACHLNSVKPDTGGYQPGEVAKAEKCFAKYLAWEREHPIKPVMVETPLVSEEFRFGGTPDLLAELGGEFVLIDFKTGGGIYESYFCQVAGYRQLLAEQGWPVGGARIVRISADDAGYEEKIRSDLDRDWQIFKCCLEIYRLQRGGGI